MSPPPPDDVQRYSAPTGKILSSGGRHLQVSRGQDIYGMNGCLFLGSLNYIENNISKNKTSSG
jgi:hypothetical protein